MIRNLMKDYEMWQEIKKADKHDENGSFFKITFITSSYLAGGLGGRSPPICMGEIDIDGCQGGFSISQSGGGGDSSPVCKPLKIEGCDNC